MDNADYKLIFESRQGLKVYKDKYGRYYKINDRNMIEEIEVKYLTDDIASVIHRDRQGITN